MTEESPLVRQWILLRMLSGRHHGATVKEMVEEMGVSEKTIRRDLESFQQATLPETRRRLGTCAAALDSWVVDPKLRSFLVRAADRDLDEPLGSSLSRPSCAQATGGLARWRLGTRFQLDAAEPAAERNRPVNFSGSVNQRFREFWTAISGCEGNPRGSFRTPAVISRNGDRRAAGGIVANPCRKGQKRETPGDRSLGAGR